MSKSFKLELMVVLADADINLFIDEKRFRIEIVWPKWLRVLLARKAEDDQT